MRVQSNPNSEIAKNKFIESLNDVSPKTEKMPIQADVLGQNFAEVLKTNKDVKVEELIPLLNLTPKQIDNFQKVMNHNPDSFVKMVEKPEYIQKVAFNFLNTVQLSSGALNNFAGARTKVETTTKLKQKQWNKNLPDFIELSKTEFSTFGKEQGHEKKHIEKMVNLLEKSDPPLINQEITKENSEFIDALNNLELKVDSHQLERLNKITGRQSRMLGVIGSLKNLRKKDGNVPKELNIINQLLHTPEGMNKDLAQAFTLTLKKKQNKKVKEKIINHISEGNNFESYPNLIGALKENGLLPANFKLENVDLNTEVSDERVKAILENPQAKEAFKNAIAETTGKNVTNLTPQILKDYLNNDFNNINPAPSMHPNAAHPAAANTAGKSSSSNTTDKNKPQFSFDFSPYKDRINEHMIEQNSAYERRASMLESMRAHLRSGMGHEYVIHMVMMTLGEFFEDKKQSIVRDQQLAMHLENEVAKQIDEEIKDPNIKITDPELEKNNRLEEMRLAFGIPKIEDTKNQFKYYEKVSSQLMEMYRKQADDMSRTTQLILFNIK